MSPSAAAALKTVTEPETTTAYGQKMPGHNAVIEVLKEQGVDTIFGYPGGAIMPIYDGLELVEHNMQHILGASEGGLGHMATGYARRTGKTGVLFVTSGPGLTNALTPIADAQGDSVPMVVISGQVPTSLIGTDAFQEVPATQLTMPITKHNMLVLKPEDLPQALRDAFRIASEGRPGVVHVDIPKNVQFAQTVFTPPKPQPAPKRAINNFQRAIDLMLQAKRPVFYVGGGVINAGQKASDTLAELINETGFPATSTLMGLGAYPTTHAAHLGMLGMHGTYEANMAMHQSDLIIAVGARFDDRVTGKLFDEYGKRSFAPNAKIIHIDIEKAEINKLVRADAPLLGDAADMLQQLQSSWRGQQYKERPDLNAWWDRIDAWRTARSLDIDPESGDDIRAQHVLQKLGALLKTLPDYTVATNVGQHQMWAAQYLPFTKPRQFLTSGKVGTMGYGLPGGIGAAWGKPDAPCIVVTGDGSWRMNTPEVETACRYDIPVKILMLDNNSLNMVGQWQRGIHGGRMSQSQFKGSTKDFVGEFKAQGHNAWGEKITHPSQVDAALKRMMASPGPYFLQVAIRNEDCYPIVEAGRVHNDMKFSADFKRRNPHLAPA